MQIYGILQTNYNSIQTNHMPITRTLTILTFAPDRTLGDISAAYKLIEELVATNTNDPELQVKINWLIKIYDLDKDKPEQLRAFEYFFTRARALGVTVVDLHMFNPTYVSISDAIEKLVPDTDLFIAFPIYQDFKDAQSIIIHNKPLLTFNEYNSPPNSAYELSHEIFRTCVKTGLGRQKMGIFVTPSIPKWHEKQYELNTHEQQVLKTLGLLDPKYATQRVLYFSYFNRYVNFNTAVNKKSFCILSLLIQAKKQRKDVDIIVRLNGLTFNTPTDPEAKECDVFSENEIALIAPFYSQIDVIDVNGTVIETRILNSDSSLPRVRVIDPYPVSTVGFKLLLTYAQPFIGATGNESFAEGISNANLMFYQIMGWKQHLFAEFLELCKKYTYENSELVYFYKNQKTYKLHSADFKHYVEGMVQIIVEKEAILLQQMEQVKQGILRDFNLGEKLTHSLRAALRNPEKIVELFNPYALSAHGINVSTPEYMLKNPSQYTDKELASQYTNSQSLDEFRQQYATQRALQTSQSSLTSSATAQSASQSSQDSETSQSTETTAHKRARSICYR